MSKTINVDGTDVTFSNELSYKQYLEHHDYLFLRKDSEDLSYGIEFSELIEQEKYFPVKRSIHNVTMALETSTFKTMDNLIDNKYAATKQDLSNVYAQIKIDVQAGRQKLARDMQKSATEFKRELYSLLFFIAIFLLVFLVLYFVLKTSSQLIVDKNAKN